MKNISEIVDSNRSIALVLTDLIAVILVLVLPALAHLLPFPLYYLDPMRLVLFAAYFVNRNNWNAFILAVALPIFSMLYSGHPIPIKAFLISMELLLNMILLAFLIRVKIPIFWSVLSSIIISKVIYYIFKFILIELAILPGSLFSTNLVLQLLIAVGLSGIFYLFIRNKFNSDKT